jgi:hypothetical protein
MDPSPRPYHAAEELIGVLEHAIQHRRRVMDVETPEAVYRGRCASLATRIVKTKRSAAYGTYRNVLEMTGVVCTPKNAPSGVTPIRYNRAHVVVADILAARVVPVAPLTDYQPSYDAAFVRRFAAYRGPVSRKDAEYLWWLGVTDLPESTEEFLAVAASTAVQRDWFPQTADAVAQRLLAFVFRGRERLGPFHRRIHRSPFLRNLLPYVPFELSAPATGGEDFSGPARDRPTAHQSVARRPHVDFIPFVDRPGRRRAAVVTQNAHHPTKTPTRVEKPTDDYTDRPTGTPARDGM